MTDNQLDAEVAVRPEAGTKVVAIIEHFHTKSQRVYGLVAVDEDDCIWRTEDDNSELAHEWNVVAWVPKDEALSALAALAAKKGAGA